MAGLDDDHEATLRELAEGLLRFDTTGGNEAPAQEWLQGRLDDLGFETYRWEADADVLAEHPSFPPADELDVAGRPSVAGVLEFGHPDAGPTVVLNGHVDVVPVEREQWTSDPFEPTWDGDALVARGAADMKSGVAACVVAALHLADLADGPGDDDLDGRVVVECVAGEEEGGIGTPAAALERPYPFERDAAIVAEPTDLTPVTATEGCAMMRLEVEGRPAHAARRWRGVDVLPRFERIRTAFADLEAERARRVTHPLYGEFEVPWPMVVGRVEAGNWASNVAGHLTAEMRLGVAPGESVAEVEAEYRDRLEGVVETDDWLAAHPPRFSRFGVQFEPAEVRADEPVVAALRGAMEANGLEETAPRGETYGADSRFYVEAGVPTVVFGPGRIEEAHFPDESIHWPDVVTAAAVLADTLRGMLAR